MTNHNVQIKIAMLEAGLRQFELAKLLNVSETTLWRMMREELPAERQEEILSLIEEWRDAH